MCERKSEVSEFRQQRHEFILAYYDMATKDLDRHLKVGWQSIVVAAGAVVSLSLGATGELPVPVAVSAALIVSFWGLANVVDANYWAARAIGFLANVEAIYFSEEDRKAFNPYIGRHPPIRLMDSLRNQFSAITAFVVVSVAFFFWTLGVRAASYGGLL